MQQFCRIVVVLAGMLLTAGPGLAQDEPVTVFLMAGQSNMDGRGRANELVGELAPYAQPFAPVQVRYHHPDVPARPGRDARPGEGSKGWGPLAPGYSGPPGGPGTFGPELGFGHAYHQARPDDQLHLLKYSRGGTTLLSDWRPEDDDGLAGGMIEFVKAELAALEAAGTEYRLVGLLWHQGESDLSAERNNPGVYKAAMLHFVDRLRTELDAPDLMVVLGGVFNDNPQGRRQEIIDALMDTAAADPRILYASSEGLTVFDETTHFDAPSQIELGRRMAEQALTLVPEPGAMGAAGLIGVLALLRPRASP